jgi:hypothetical protein
MLIVGQRTNVKHASAENASSHENIIKISKTGKLFTAWGEDYFITNSNYPWKDCPEVVVGRLAYDNWLVLPFFWFKQWLDQKILSATFSFH